MFTAPGMWFSPGRHSPVIAILFVVIDLTPEPQLVSCGVSPKSSQMGAESCKTYDRYLS